MVLFLCISWLGYKNVNLKLLTAGFLLPWPFAGRGIRGRVSTNKSAWLLKIDQPQASKETVRKTLVTLSSLPKSVNPKSESYTPVTTGDKGLFLWFYEGFLV